MAFFFLNTLIQKYFPNLTYQQQVSIDKLYDLYDYWNNRINVISRKDFDNFYERHVLHSLAIAKVIQFLPNSFVLDIGTGGGFPGIPLAILFPQTKFVLVDSVGKKINVVKEVAYSLELQNIQAVHDRAENLNMKFDFIVSRAVTEMKSFLNLTQNKFKKENKHNFKNGIFYLKGGDLTEELSGIKNEIQIFNLNTFYTESFFETKKLVYVNCNS